MKRISIILIIIVLASGCRTTKKSAKSNIQAQIETSVKTESKVADKAKEEKNLNIETTTTTTKTEFNEPDSTGIVKVADKGSIKSITTIVTTTKQVDLGKVETEHKEEAKAAISSKENVKEKIYTSEKKTVPIRWGWIFGILALLTGIFIYFRNSPIVKSVLSVIRKFLKI